jgi:hypothetical protein
MNMQALVLGVVAAVVVMLAVNVARRGTGLIVRLAMAVGIAALVFWYFKR